MNIYLTKILRYIISVASKTINRQINKYITGVFVYVNEYP